MRPKRSRLIMASKFSKVARILKNRCAALRSEDDLRCIRNAVDPALDESDDVWRALSARQKLALCKYFELKTVFEEEGQSLCVEGSRARGRIRSGISHFGGLYILVHGRAIVSCGRPSLLVHGGGTSIGGGSQLGKVFGRLALPSQNTDDFFRKTEANQHEMSLYHRFVSLQNEEGNDVNIHFEKGSTYIVLPESQSRPFLGRLNASLITKRVFNDVGIEKLLCKQTHECNNESKATKVYGFRAGQILIKEGDDPDRVLFIATGSCLIFRSNEEQEVHCAGSMLSPCFIGIAPLFDDSDVNNDDSIDGKQPASAVAVTNGYAFSFCSLCFMRSLDRTSSKPSLMRAFQSLAKSQMAAWDICTIVEDDVEAEENNAWATQTQNDNVEEDDEIVPSPANSQQNSLANVLEVESEEYMKVNALNESVLCENPEMSIDLGAIFLKGRLRRSKLLSAIHDTISNDLSADIHSDLVGGGVAVSSAVHNRETWLLDGDKSNIMADTMVALSEGCDVDFTKCEGKDPFHKFTINTPTDNNDDSHDSMSLEMPSHTPNRVDQMAEKCLGRKRPPQYDDSDPFLKPCPSVVSRKMHGKTLPVVRRIKCEDPVVYRGNETNWMNHLA